MEEKTKMPGGFFDKDHLLVDKEIADPFEEKQQILEYPFELSTTHRKGYVRYKIQGNTVVIVDYVFTSD